MTNGGCQAGQGPAKGIGWLAVAAELDEGLQGEPAGCRWQRWPGIGEWVENGPDRRLDLGILTAYDFMH